MKATTHLLITGHFATWKELQLFAEEVRSVFRSMSVQYIHRSFLHAAAIFALFLQTEQLMHRNSQANASTGSSKALVTIYHRKHRKLLQRLSSK
jgi:hypothetical protein